MKNLKLTGAAIVAVLALGTAVYAGGGKTPVAYEYKLAAIQIGERMDVAEKDLNNAIPAGWDIVACAPEKGQFGTTLYYTLRRQK